ncbi:polyamine-modulated factor 1-binding protein 1-like [Condylostylus longicornis]|uniref:polyamine-modulated factor 1-binding protein 1-like n=1 Tax=Condylostylus longicornis TaxID=2530218 RepID=UPI00244E29FE|nr:polyamine-modulated factor 1-binding protein 1-like [Condylostylus longicornis]
MAKKKLKVPPSPSTPPPPPAEPKYEFKKSISELDMMTDLDKDFWGMANKCVRILTDENRIELATDIKTLVKVLETLQKQYTQIVLENRELLPRVKEADEKLHSTLKITVDTQEAMNSMKLVLENSRKELDASRNRELELQHELNQMLLKCETFTKKEEIEEKNDDAEDRLQHENEELNRRLKMNRIYREQAVLLEKINLQKQMKKLQEDFEESKEINKDLLSQCRELETKLEDKIITLKEITKDLDIKPLNVELNEKITEYGKIQKKLETTNSEKITLQRSLQTCSEEKTNLKSLLSKTQHQIIQLDEEISLKQANINTQNYQIEKLRSEKQETEKEHGIVKKMLQSNQEELKEMKEKNNSLTKVIEVIAFQK